MGDGVILFTTACCDWYAGGKEEKKVMKIIDENNKVTNQKYIEARFDTRLGWLNEGGLFTSMR